MDNDKTHKSARKKKVVSYLVFCVPAVLFLALLSYILLSSHIERKRAIRSEIQMEVLVAVSGDAFKTYSKTLDAQNQLFECDINSHLFEYVEFCVSFNVVKYKGNHIVSQTKNEVYPLYTDSAVTLTSPNKVSLTYEIEDENGERYGIFQSKIFTYVTEEFGVGKLLENAWGTHKISIYYDGENVDAQFDLIFNVAEDKRMDGITLMPYYKDGFEIIFTPYTFIPKAQTGDYDMFIMQNTVLDPTNSMLVPVYRIPCFVALDASNQFVAGLSQGLKYDGSQWKAIWNAGFSNIFGGGIDIWGRHMDELYKRDRIQSSKYIENVPFAPGIYLCSVSFTGNDYYKPVYYTCYIVIPEK